MNFTTVLAHAVYACSVNRLLEIPLHVANNCTNGAVRLVNGTTSNEGRAEYCYEGDWVPFCGMSSRTASHICSQLGYNYTCKYTQIVASMLFTWSC